MRGRMQRASGHGCHLFAGSQESSPIRVGRLSLNDRCRSGVSPRRICRTITGPCKLRGCHFTSSNSASARKRSAISKPSSQSEVSPGGCAENRNSRGMSHVSHRDAVPNSWTEAPSTGSSRDGWRHGKACLRSSRSSIRTVSGAAVSNSCRRSLRSRRGPAEPSKAGGTWPIVKGRPILILAIIMVRKCRRIFVGLCASLDCSEKFVELRHCRERPRAEGSRL